MINTPEDAYQIASAQPDTVLDHADQGAAVVQFDQVRGRPDLQRAHRGAAELADHRARVACRQLQDRSTREGSVTTERLAARGIEVPVWRSGNAPGGDEANSRFLHRFRNRVRQL